MIKLLLASLIIISLVNCRGGVVTLNSTMESDEDAPLMRQFIKLGDLTNAVRLKELLRDSFEAFQVSDNGYSTLTEYYSTDHRVKISLAIYHKLTSRQSLDQFTDRATLIVDFSSSKYCLKWQLADGIFHLGSSPYHPLSDPSNVSYIFSINQFRFLVTLGNSRQDPCVSRVFINQAEKRSP